MSKFTGYFRIGLCFIVGMLLLLPLFNCGSSSKTVVVPPTVTLAITPKTPTVALGGTQLFTAAITGTTNTAVTWSVTESGGGTIDSTGKYTATKAGTFHVVATSVESSTATDTTTVTVIGVAISPKTPTLGVLGTQVFTATVTGTTNTAVTWSVTGGGTIDSAGNYTAAGKAGTYHVIATSQAFLQATDTATVSVTAPAPVFTSAAPTTAVEGSPYTYAVTATDAANTDITFTLKNSPSDATISAGVINWTPTTAESRTDNSFTVVATTAAGGVNTQTWNVNPNGTIRGSWIDTYWGARNSKTPYPHDISDPAYFAISAVVPNGDGTVTSIPGTGNSDGTFTIENVPAGYFWLTALHNSTYSQAFWTNSAVYDFGTDLTGLPPVADPCTATLNLTLSGLDTDNVESLVLTVPNKDRSYSINLSGSIITGPLTVCPIDPTVGDAAFIFQAEGFTLPSGFGGEAEVMGPALAVPTTLAVADGAAAPLTGVLTNNPTSTYVRLRRSDWVGSFANVGAVNPVPNEIVAQAVLQPYVSDRAAEQDNWQANLWWIDGDSQSWNVDPGTIQFNNPYPSSWLPLFAANGYAEMVDNGGNQIEISNSYATTAPQTNGFVPLMSAIQAPLMNGANLYTAATSDTTAVTLSWTAPTGLAPYGYDVYYYCPDNSCPDGDIYTSSTSFTFPAGLLKAGSTYVFDIGAMADSRASILTTPWRGGYPQAWADVVSAPLSISAAGSESVPGQHRSVAAAGQKQVIHTKTGSFLVTSHGNQPLDGKARMLARFNHAQSTTTTKPVPAVKK